MEISFLKKNEACEQYVKEFQYVLFRHIQSHPYQQVVSINKISNKDNGQVMVVIDDLCRPIVSHYSGNIEMSLIYDNIPTGVYYIFPERNRIVELDWSIWFLLVAAFHSENGNIYAALRSLHVRSLYTYEDILNASLKKELTAYPLNVINDQIQKSEKIIKDARILEMTRNINAGDLYRGLIHLDIIAFNDSFNALLTVIQKLKNSKIQQHVAVNDTLKWNIEDAGYYYVDLTDNICEHISDTKLLDLIWGFGATTIGCSFSRLLTILVKNEIYTYQQFAETSLEDISKFYGVGPTALTAFKKMKEEIPWQVKIGE